MTATLQPLPTPIASEALNELSHPTMDRMSHNRKLPAFLQASLPMLLNLTLQPLIINSKHLKQTCLLLEIQLIWLQSEPTNLDKYYLKCKNSN